MTFYPVDPYTEQVLHDEDAIGKVRVEVDWEATCEYEEIPEADIEEAFFESAEREDGGTTAEGSLLLSNESGRYDLSGAAGVRRHAGSPVRVSFSAGKDAAFFPRFSLFIHEDGIQEILGPGKAKRVRIPLSDLSARLGKIRAGKPFGEAAYIHWNYVSVLPTAAWPESVLSILCAIGGLAISDLSCPSIQLGLPFVKLTGSVWDELCTLTRAYRAHLETPIEKPLVFLDSPYAYGCESPQTIEPSFHFRTEEAFSLSVSTPSGRYRNIVNLDYDIPIEFNQEPVWRFNEPPKGENEYGTDGYPITVATTRAIQLDGYLAPLMYHSWQYGLLPLEKVWLNEDMADALYLEYDEGTLNIPVLSFQAEDKTLAIKLEALNDLYVLDLFLDASGFAYKRGEGIELRNEEEILEAGEHPLFVRNQYLCPYPFKGTKQYQDWAARELAERSVRRRTFAMATNRLAFHSRVGAWATLDGRNCIVRALSLSFRTGTIPVLRITLEER